MLTLHQFNFLLKSLESVTKKKLCLEKNFCTFLVKDVFKKKNIYLLNTVACIHSDKQIKKEEESNVIIFNDFEKANTKNKETFYRLIKHYDENYKAKSGQAAFITEALKHMKEFGVDKDIKAYKILLNLFPKDIYVARNIYQVSFMKYPRQQFAAIDLLDKMENNGVIPDAEIGEMVYSIFGRAAHPAKKYQRMLYWSTKFKNKSPWLLPKEVPTDPLLLGKMAVERITSVDLQSKISLFRTEEIAESIDKTWIVSGQSKKQRELLKSHSLQAPVVVEGGDVVWLRGKFINYFVLKSDCEPPEYKPPKDTHDLSKMQTVFFNPDYEFDEQELRSIHEQDDGIIYAVCVTGTSSKDSLLSWVRLLQKKENPLLEKIPILFRFKNAASLPVPFSEDLMKTYF